MKDSNDQEEREEKRERVLTRVWLVIDIILLFMLVYVLYLWLSPKFTGRSNAAPTEAPTVTAAVTPEKEPTGDPDGNATKTATPEPTREAPTKAPKVSTIPTAIPTPTVTPEPTATPIPPTPTPIVPEGELLGEYQTGENAWYRLYEDGTLLVTGTGRVEKFISELEYWEGDNWTIVYEYNPKKLEFQELCDSVSKEVGIGLRIVVEEGITELGELSFVGLGLIRGLYLPSTLVSIGECAFYGTDFVNRKTGLQAEVIGLTPELQIDEHAFFDTRLAVEGYEQYTVPLPTPTLTPTPTPTPIPDPERPRLVQTIQMETDVTYEFWDNGYLYVKGKGRIEDVEWGFFLWDYVDDEFLRTIHTIVVEEGITYMGEHTFCGNHLYGVKECWLPSTLTEMHHDCGLWCINNSHAVVHGYYQGRAVTITTEEKGWDVSDFIRAIEDPEWAKAHDLTITWDE